MIEPLGSVVLGASGKISKGDYLPSHVCLPAGLSVPPHGATWLPLEGLSWHLIFEDFWKIFRNNSSFITI